MGNDAFLKQIDAIVEETSKLGTELGVDETADDSSFVLSNKNKNTAVIVGRVEVSGNSIIVAYIININKWNWALTEGFSRDQIIESMSTEVFKEIDVEEVSSYLS